MKFIPFDKRLKTKSTCPFCHASEIISFTGWTMDEEKVNSTSNAYELTCEE